MPAARRSAEAPDILASGLPAPGKPAAATGFMASGLGVALFSSAVFGLSGSFATAYCQQRHAALLDALTYALNKHGERPALLETGWTPGAAVTARLTGAALILAVPAVPALRGRWHQLRDNWLTVLLFGLIGVAACQLFYFNAVARLSVGVALLLEYLAPVLIVLWLWAASRKRPRPLTVAGTLLSLGGLVLVLDLTGAIKIDFIGVLWFGTFLFVLSGLAIAQVNGWAADDGEGRLEAMLMDVCADFGLDTIETGVAIGVAMEGGLLPFGDGPGAIKVLAGQGVDEKEIRERVLGREDLVGYASFGEYSKRAFVKSVISDT